MSKLTARIEALETQHAAAQTIVITRDDEHYQLCGSDRVLTRDEVTALPDVLIIRIVRAQAVKP